jgi:cytochrome c oxidase subunit 2
MLNKRSPAWPLTTAVLLILLAGCSADPSAGAPVGEPAGTIADLMWFMVIVGAAVYVLVVVLLALALFRRHRREPEEGAPPPFLGSRKLILSGGIALPAVVAVVLMVLTLVTMRAGVEPDEQSLRVKVTGHQWWWGVEYRDSGIQSANQIHVPVDRPIEIQLESDNVIHSFWAPALGGKVDLIPGVSNTITLQVDEPGVYGGKCAEYCGLQHAKMAFIVVALEPEEFDSWEANRLQAVRDRASPELSAGLGVFLGAGCGRCHGIGGTVADGMVGPDLTHIGQRLTLGAGTVPNTRGNLSRWIADPSSLKPGVKMPPSEGRLTPEQMGVLVDYLESLE